MGQPRHVMPGAPDSSPITSSAFFTHFILPVLAVLATLVLSLSSSIALHLAVPVVLAILSLFAVRRRLAHPLAWMVPALVIYSVSLPASQWLLDLPMRQPVTSHALKLESIAITSLIVGLTLPLGGRITQPITTGRARRPLPGPLVDAGRWLLWVSLAVCLTLITAYATFAPTVKTQFVSAHPRLVQAFGMAFSIFLLALALRFFSAAASGGDVVRWASIALVFAGLASYVTLERDLLVRTLIVCAFAYHFLVAPLTIRRGALLAGGAMVFVAALGIYRSRAGESPGRLGVVGALREFATPTANLMVLLDDENGGATSVAHFLSDVREGLDLPSWDRTRDARTNTGAWFNRKYFQGLYAQGGGRGFTLVGAGYVYDGTFGVILLFCAIGGIVGWVFRRAQREDAWLVIYIAAVPGLLYGMRMDTATVLSYAVKQVVIPLGLLFILGSLLRLTLPAEVEGA